MFVKLFVVSSSADKINKSFISQDLQLLANLVFYVVVPRMLLLKLGFKCINLT